MTLFSGDGTAGVAPNILFIVMDATKARSLSCYGYHRPTTPHLERFAERCVVYDAAISPAGWSLPAHASMFTGLYPSKHGAHDEHKYLDTDQPTMAELLRSLGYHTVALCDNAYVGPATGLDRGFEEFNESGKLTQSVRHLNRKLRTGIAAVSGRRDSGARHTNKQIRTVFRRSQAEGRPVFVFAHYGEAHGPYRPRQNDRHFLPPGVSLKAASLVNQDQWKYLVTPSTMTERDFEILTALYDSEIAYLDTRIAEVLGWVEDLGILDRTMVIITADHGENVGDHQMMAHKYCLYDTLLHVPLIIHYPAGTVAPGRVQHQVQTLDLLPTILAMLGHTSSDIHSSLQGYDLLSSTKHEFTVAEQAQPDLSTFHKRFPDADVSRFDRALKMIRTERYKYIWASDGKHELYDLRKDANEEQNIVAERPELAEDLDRRLAEWRGSFEEASPSAEAPEFDETVRARLRALGYLE
jgi:arylsulfatase A-like enzyme